MSTAATLAQAAAALRAGRDIQADTLCRQILSTTPGHPDALQILGLLALKCGNTALGIERLRAAAAADPRNALTWCNIGQALAERGDWPGSLESYLRAAQLQPRFAVPHSGAGNALLQMGRLEEALSCYDQALRLDPDDVGALGGRGTAWRRLGQHERALADFERALQLAPGLAEFVYRRAEALRDLRRFPEAADAFERALAMSPDRDHLLGNLLHARLQTCDWRDYERLLERCRSGLAQGRRVCLPGMSHGIFDSTREQTQCARAFAANRQRPASTAVAPVSAAGRDRLHIAYVSADFREHPVASLLVGVIEQHDRTRFAVTGLSLMPPQATPLGRRIQSAFEQYIDVSGLTDERIAGLMRELRVDVAVDLMGFSGGGRPGIFARRAAPVQVSYLGYTGTSGADDLDFILADRVVIPEDEASFYTERVEYLPGCYLPADDQRQIAARLARSECGLPEDAFVFCCFNAPYKITPPVFQAWMTLLREVPDSLLWLSAAPEVTRDHLRRSAEIQGISVDRLLFAEREAEPARHLARLACADLFLDTTPFGAHASASDALWAGLPVLTLRGGSFAGRVAASLLSAAGLPELVTDSLPAYTARARELANDAWRLAACRDQLAAARARGAPFNTAVYTRGLEAAYRRMVGTPMDSPPA